MTKALLVLTVTLALVSPRAAQAGFTIPDTGQGEFYGVSNEIRRPSPGDPFYGQDAHYQGAAMQYRDNGDGTVTDLVTGLMWVQDPGEKVLWEQGMAGAAQCRVGGYSDWRVPTIKELYSLMDFNGVTGRTASQSRPYLNTEYFVFEFGDESAGERIIDSQWMTSNVYGSRVMMGMRGMFGVNFADGRIKCYPCDRLAHGAKTFFVRYVRGETDYGVNDFVDNRDGTVTDRASDLMWMQVDSGALEGSEGAMTWEQALQWAENLEYAGYSDWRLPNIKELQSIVDYSRSPDITNSPAIDPIFFTTAITNPGGALDYPYFWSSTTHLDNQRSSNAAYIAFGRGLGYMAPNSGPPRDGPGSMPTMEPPQGRHDSGFSRGGPLPGRTLGLGNMGGPGFGGPRTEGSGHIEMGNPGGELLDVHGAGCQRSDPKSGDPGDFEWGRGPQGDVIYIYNYVRLVRDAD